MKKTKDKVSKRDSYLRRVYGITEVQYNSLLKKQLGLCAICKKPPKLNLCVDHNHQTLAIRGLLCGFCNRRVIGRHTSATLFEAAAEYLKQDTGWYAPPKKRKKRKKRVRRN